MKTSATSRIDTIRIKNFKAIRDSKPIRFSPLIVLIGNNGSGKSSVIEALEMMQTIALRGIDAAMEPWHGFEHIWNQAVGHDLCAKLKNQKQLPNPLCLSMNGLFNNKKIDYNFEMSLEPSRNKIVVNNNSKLVNGQLDAVFEAWQFLKLQPPNMFEQRYQKRTFGNIRLNTDGSNIAEYLQSIRDKDLSAFDGIIDALKFVLPYAIDLKPAITTELEKKIYLQLSEKGISTNLPGWLLSTGTMRILGFETKPAVASVLRGKPTVASVLRGAA